ncbi:YopX family protein [Staphylococcus kloosii]|uniref:YopX protein domain-containing protein n=1 Tax=Staphylococcus kloosii TaxID=29384 RepID=A0A151A653_9STAP|nr:YopX family protein [Staphylococcus kloosii]KYH14899.1 hypothetical protein A0131_08935 [Staphylococcus kloosii]
MVNLKFRAWDKFDEKMLEVHGINFDAQGIWTREMIDDESDGNFVFLDEIELLQSTGLKDRNEIEMFEGDVVKTKYGEHGRHIGIVTFRYGKFLSIGVKQYEGYVEELDCMFEIIGNKFEHPHLLEE